jgi:hypothetical protein
MTEDELQPVLRSMRAANINIVAIHQHMTHEQPRILFLHYWGAVRRPISRTRSSQRWPKPKRLRRSLVRLASGLLSSYREKLWIDSERQISVETRLKRVSFDRAASFQTRRDYQ